MTEKSEVQNSAGFIRTFMFDQIVKAMFLLLEETLKSREQLNQERIRRLTREVDSEKVRCKAM